MVYLTTSPTAVSALVSKFFTASVVSVFSSSVKLAISARQPKTEEIIVKFNGESWGKILNKFSVAAETSFPSANKVFASSFLFFITFSTFTITLLKSLSKKNAESILLGEPVGEL